MYRHILGTKYIIKRVNRPTPVKQCVQTERWTERYQAATERLPNQIRHTAARLYFQLARFNYEYHLLTRTNQTPAGQFRSYELLNRHGKDSMLAAMAEFCGPDATIYDIGANVGIYTLALASSAKGRRLIAFEPAPVTAEQLRANVGCNDLEKQVHIHQCALGGTDDERPFYISTLPELSGFDRQSATRWGASVAEVVSVPVRRLDTIQETMPAPDVIKLDVEGAGPEVLRGGQATIAEERPVFFIEPHEEELSETQEMQSILLGHDYRIEQYDDYWRCLPI